MIPEKAIAAGHAPVPVAPPKNGVRYRWRDVALGGVDVQEPSLGVLHQLWTATYDAFTGVVTLAAENGKSYPIHTQHGIDEIGLMFDNNANWVLGYRLTNGRGFISFYSDSVLGRVVLPLGRCSSMMVGMDDARGISIGVTDILVTYIDAQRRIWVRGQREKYRIARDMQVVVAEGQELAGFGMGANGRIQWITSNQYIRALP